MSVTTQPLASQAGLEGLDSEQLIRAFRLMHTARRLDDREVALKRQNRIFFQISGAGHEAIQVAAGLRPALRPRLVLSLLPRPRPLPHPWGHAARNAAAGRGRRRRSRFRRPPDALALGSHRQQHRQRLLPHRHAISPGRRLRRSLALPRNPETDEVTLVSSGEGATSEGEFWESLNAACLKRLPVVFLIEDNGYAISVPVECQTAGGSISALRLWLPRTASPLKSMAPISSPPTAP